MWNQTLLMKSCLKMQLLPHCKVCNKKNNKEFLSHFHSCFNSSIEVGQITAAVNYLSHSSKRPSNSGMLPEAGNLPPVHPHSPAPRANSVLRRTSTAQNSVPGSPILGGRRSPANITARTVDQRMLSLTSFCRLEECIRSESLPLKQP